jgi:hypothetical protein
MKTRFAALLIAMLLAVTGSVLHAAQASVTGAWTFSASDMTLRMNLTQEGNGVTGTLDSPHGPIQLKGEFAGGQLTLSGTSEAIQLSASGSLKNDGSLAGSLTSNVGDMTWTAVRARATK